MKNFRLPFHLLGIEPQIGYRVIDIVDKLTFLNPNTPLSIQKISQQSGYNAEDIKNIFYLLLSIKKIKATFLPRHKKCDQPVGEPEKSSEIIFEKIRNEEFWCNHCHATILNASEIEIQLIFWKLGANVK